MGKELGRRREEHRAPVEERVRDLLLYSKRCNRRGATDNALKAFRRINKLLSREAQQTRGEPPDDN